MSLAFWFSVLRPVSEFLTGQRGISVAEITREGILNVVEFFELVELICIYVCFIVTNVGIGEIYSKIQEQLI